LQHERCEPGLVLPVEADALDAPPPPLHVLDVAHRLRFFFPSGGVGPAPSSGPRIRGECSASIRSISARIRAMNCTAVSPGSAVIGSPYTTPTASRPGLGQLEPRGCARPAPTSATGRHGAPVAIERAAAPGLNGWSTR